MLDIKGLAKEVCRNSVLQVDTENSITLLLKAGMALLMDLVSEAEISQLFSDYFGYEIQVNVQISSNEEETPSQIDDRVVLEEKQELAETVKNDPIVRQLCDEYGASVVPDSVKAIKQDEPG